MYSFEERLPAIEAGHDITDLVFGDIGNDGDLDLVTVSSAATEFAVEVHIDHDGFLPPFAVAGSRPSAVALADMNADGLLDILIAQQSSNLEECRQFGSCVSLRQVWADAQGGFTGGGKTRIIPFLESARRIVAADFNKDGNMDVLVAGFPINAGEPSLHLLWGGTPGTGVNGTIQTFGTSGPAGDVVLGDLNNDTFIDFAAAIGPGAASTLGHLDLYRNEAGTFGGVFDSKSTHALDANMRLVTGQFEVIDRKLDVAVAVNDVQSPFGGRQGGFYLFRGNGNGGIAATTSVWQNSSNFQDLAAADMDEDGASDLALGGSEYVLVFNIGSLATGATSSARRVAGADFNHDGLDDIAYLSSARNVSILLNVCRKRWIEMDLTSSPNPSTFGGSVTFTASFTVKPNAPVPSGVVTLKKGTTVLATSNVNSAGNAIFTVNNLAVGSHELDAQFGGDPVGGYGAVGSLWGLLHTVNRPPFGAPLNVVATGNAAANAITIRWTSTADVSTHHVMRRNDLGQWNTVGSSSTEQFTDSTVDPSRAYVYTVRSVHATNGTVSPDGNLDVATTMNPVRPSDKIIRAADTSDVRSLANSLRRSAGLPPFSFTDPALTGLRIKAVHLTELRTAITQARAALSLPPVALAQPTITPRVTKAKFNDLQELRVSFH